MPQPTDQTDEVEDVLDRSSPNIGAPYFTLDEPGGPAFAPARTPVLPPGTPRGSSGAPLPPPPPNIQWTSAAQPTATGTGTLQQQIGDLPLAQAEQAYSAALKFQAVRGYQADLQRGVAPHEALAKWAPMMFTAPKEATLAGAASMLRAGAPTIHSANGQLFRVGPNGQAVPISPGKPVAPPKPTVFDTQEHKSYLDRVRGLEKELDEDPNGPEADAKRQEIQYYQKRANDVRNRFSAPSQTKGKRIRVKHPGGKVGTIPEDQRDEALKAGYTIVP